MAAIGCWWRIHHVALASGWTWAIHCGCQGRCCLTYWPSTLRLSCSKFSPPARSTAPYCTRFGRFKQFVQQSPVLGTKAIFFLFFEDRNLFSLAWMQWCAKVKDNCTRSVFYFYKSKTFMCKDKVHHKHDLFIYLSKVEETDCFFRSKL